MSEDIKQALYDKLKQNLNGTNILFYATVEPIKVMGDAESMENALKCLADFAKIGNDFVTDGFNLDSSDSGGSSGSDVA